MKSAILVIKHGALGDIILATAAFAAVRKHHPDAHLILLTSSTYLDLANRMPYFNEVWVDNRAKFWQVKRTLRVWRMLQGDGPQRVAIQRVYDLQCSDRTALYFRSLPKKPEWVGSVLGCSHPRRFPPGQYHALDSVVKHWGYYGIEVANTPDVSWLSADISALPLPKPYVVMIPGCSIKHAQKRWTADGFAAVINRLAEEGVTSVIVGHGPDRAIIQAILAKVKHPDRVVDLCDRSPLPVLASVARGAQAVLGVDTGPMHCAAATHVPSVVLFSRFKSPVLCAPRGKAVRILEVDDLQHLSVKQVMKVFPVPRAAEPFSRHPGESQDPVKKSLFITDE